MNEKELVAFTEVLQSHRALLVGEVVDSETE